MASSNIIEQRKAKLFLSALGVLLISVSWSIIVSTVFAQSPGILETDFKNRSYQDAAPSTTHDSTGTMFFSGISSDVPAGGGFRLVRSRMGQSIIDVKILLAENEVDLNTIGSLTPGTNIFGEGFNDQIGWSTSGIGDVNGDGLDDFLVGAPGLDAMGKIDVGAVYLALGKDEFISPLGEKGSIDAQEYIQIIGLSEKDQFGFTISGAGDVDGDGLDDFLVGAPLAERDTDKNRGEAYIIFGSTSFFVPGDTIELSTLLDSQQASLIRGEQNGDIFTGSSVSGIGDINGDNFDDILIGVAGASNSTGEVYVVYGTATFPDEIRLFQLTAVQGLKIVGVSPPASRKYGSNVSGVGDVNGDGFSDFLVAADAHNQGEDGDLGVPVYLIYGGQKGFKTFLTVDLKNYQVAIDGNSQINGWDINSDKKADFRGMAINGIHSNPLPGEHSGTSVSGAGDVNGDGFSDFLISSVGADPNGETNAGTVYLVYGSPVALDSTDGELDVTTELDRNTGVVFHGLEAEAYTGLSVSGAGDVNGDGFSDILIGAFGARNEHGSTYLVFGKQNRIVNVQGEPVFDLSIRGPEGLPLFLHLTNVISRQRSGWSVSSAGDVNGDGFSDILIGAPFELGKGSGRVYAIYGSDTQGPSRTDGATYNQFVASGRDNLSLKTISPSGVGLSGGSFHGVPLSKLSIGFRGGGSGVNDGDASIQEVTLFRQAVPDFTNSLWDTPEVFEKVNVYWQVTTNRVNTSSLDKMQSTLVFHLNQKELENITDSRGIRIFYTPNMPSESSCWVPLPFQPTDIDEEKNTISVTREHLSGEGRFDISGYYTVLRVEWAYELGEYIPPPCISVNSRPELLNNQGDVIPAIQTSLPNGNATENGFWHEGTNRLYATGVRSDDPNITEDGEMTIHWKQSSNNSIVTISTQTIKTRWPVDDTSYQFHISDSTGTDLTKPNQGDNAYISTRLLATELGTGVSQNDIQSRHIFRDTGIGRSLLIFSTGASDVISPVFFLRVKTITHDDSQYVLQDQAIIGQEIIDVNLHDEFCGSPWIFNADSNAIGVFNPGANYYRLEGNTSEEREQNRRQGTGPIIPVNEVIQGVAEDFVIIYYERSTKVLTAGSVGTSQEFISQSTMCWGYQAVNYGSPIWSTDSNKIVIASLDGTGPLDAFGEIEIYVQNDPTKDGFNPNEEHALELSGTVYALRDDLNDPNLTSKPYVLVNFSDPDNNDRPSMAVWQVEAEDEDNSFQYDGTAGKLIQAPLPLSILHATAGNCSNTISTISLGNGVIGDGSYKVVGEVFEDKNHDFWALAGGNDNGAREIVMRYWYPVRSDFYFPDLPVLSAGKITPGATTGVSGVLPEGTCVPWLDNHLNTQSRPDNRLSQEDGTPVDIRFTIYWPDLHPNQDFREVVPELLIGETLVKPGNGLPDITGRISAQVAYQQSVENGFSASVALIEPLRESAIHLEELPEDTDAIKDIADQGIKIVFNQLPPHLKPRLSYDPLAKQLRFKGFFVEPSLGDPYILPNVLTETEITFLTTVFSTNLAWVEAINKLPTPDDTFANALYVTGQAADFIRDGATICAPIRNNGIDDQDSIIILATDQGDKRIFVDGATKIFDVDNNDASIDSFISLRAKSASLTQACVFTSENTLVGNPVGQTKGLAATGAAEGYITLVFENDPITGNLPVVVQVIKVTCPLTTGSLIVIEPDCIFDEKLTLRHTSDLGGRSDEYIYEWRTLPDVDGTPPKEAPETWLAFDPGGADQDTTTPGKQVQGKLDITIGGPGLFTLSDNWFVMRYKKKDFTANSPACSDGYSDWTNAQLAPGWIKRVLGKITPFTQRISDGGLAGAEDRFARYRNNQINTVVSMLTQAGSRWNGDVALNCANLNASPQDGGNGLIEIYETILGRGKDLSISGIPSVDYAPANTALLFAASRIVDLYMLVGNEAFADAADPTIAISTEINNAATSIHAFMNQTANLLEEELVLLRGRDDIKAPGVELHPVYNRFIWNFTTDFSGGEVAYALNYNIKDASGNVDGEINEDDAAILYPQGHGDAWGHYLQAIKTYYRLLRHPKYTWVPRSEAVLVAGKPITVDFFDERKFVNAAAAKARTGAAIVNLTYRANYSEDPEDQWKGYKDSDSQRAWGLAEWGSRAGQGTYFDWVVGNAILPDEDNTGKGIQKVDRETVWELHELASIGLDIQNEVDKADKGLNPLGLAKNILSFDIDPNLIKPIFGTPQSHFDQIYRRALQALENAVTAFNFANDATQALRGQSDSTADFQDKVNERERDFTNRLIEIFGRPYPEDLGVGKLYPGGYTGPDLWHYMYVDREELSGELPDLDIDFTPLEEITIEYNGTDLYDQTFDSETGEFTNNERIIQYTINTEEYRFEKPSGFTKRQAPGEIQLAISDVIQANFRLEKALQEYDNLLFAIECQIGTIERRSGLKADQINVLIGREVNIVATNLTSGIARGIQLGLKKAASVTQSFTKTTMEAIPKSVIVGLAGGGDILSAPRAGLALSGVAVSEGLSVGAIAAELVEVGAQFVKEAIDAGLDIEAERLDQNFEIFLLQGDLNQLIRKELTKRQELFNLAEALNQSSGRQEAVVARGITLLEDRARFRRKTAAAIQEFRHKDMAFRIFRNDLVQKFRAQFDLAAMYAFLAASVYDYETCLLDGDPRGPGEKFMTDIIHSRSLGIVLNGIPQTAGTTGDPGLADTLARMNGNWSVLKSQLGFNNPQTETNLFSVRKELERIADEQTWIQFLSNHRVDNLFDIPEFNRFAIPFAGATNDKEPGIIIPFETMIQFGKNFFGRDILANDSSYDSTKFATKIRSVGVWFEEYDGLGLSNTPRIYLIPVGQDVFRSPTGNRRITRSWKILDQQIPVPFQLSGGGLSNPDYIPMIDGLTGELAAIRRFGQFRAHDGGEFSLDDMNVDSRLVGRSVWNTRWLLIIPAGNLLNDRENAMNRFIGVLDNQGNIISGGVKDIKIFFQTYAYSGI